MFDRILIAGPVYFNRPFVPVNANARLGAGMLESELFAFLEGTTDAAFSVSEQGEILSWNGAAERLFGYSSSEVLGKSCFQVLHGRGVLGTQVCHEGCSILESAGGQAEIPNFDLQVRLRSGKRS